MFKQFIVMVALVLVALPAAGIECLASSQPKQPILVLGRVSSDIDGIKSADMERAMRERLKAGGRYRVMLSDQYEYALKSRQVDKCTTAFVADMEIEMTNVDASASYGVRGLVTRYEFVATVRVKLLPDKVTLDEFSIKDTANIVIAGTAAGKAFARLFENVALAFESRRDDWSATKMPGLDNAIPTR